MNIIGIDIITNYSHGVVEELLELFVDKVDTDLFECIEFEDLKPWGGQF